MNDVVNIEKRAVERRDLLQEAGFDFAAQRLHVQTSNLIDSDATVFSKARTAFDNFMYVRQSQIDKFQGRLKQRSLKMYTCPIKDYKKGIPPAYVLQAVIEAKAKRCFDYFEVAWAEWFNYPKPVRDPIVFGRIIGVEERFYIAQWGDDINILDILQEK
jgi:hypothetical protein